MIRIFGDIHGQLGEYFTNLNTAEESILVGDVGIGFVGGEKFDDFLKETLELKPKHRFIRGNHDNPSVVKTYKNYISDGTVEDDWMFVGGAWSIDKAYRKEGFDWWSGEQLSLQELNLIKSTYLTVRPRVMVTHDCPTLAAYYVFIKHLPARARYLYLNDTAEAFQEMFELHQPERWYFGHWHHTRDETINGTKFQCIGEQEYIDVEK
jgi:hypothetical protein